MKVSAYIPCHNNDATIAAAVSSLREQSVPPDELFVVDDGSSDRSVEVVRAMGARVIVHEKNCGRGAVRARAMTEARHELVLACDATITLPPEFLSRALVWFKEPKVAAVFGRVGPSSPGGVIERWRDRHLFKAGHAAQVNRQASLATGDVLLRKTPVLQAGNFNPRLFVGEDAELGQRLLTLGWEVIFDPDLIVHSVAAHTLAQLLERYWRWNVGAARFSGRAYLRQIRYSMNVMAREDLRQHDVASAMISLFCPHYLFWRTKLCKSPNPQR